MSIEPSIDTLEELRYLVAVRSAQAALAAELLKPHEFDSEVLEVLDRLTSACSALSEIVERHDWANEMGE